MLSGDFLSKALTCFPSWRASSFFLHGGPFYPKNRSISPNIGGMLCQTLTQHYVAGLSEDQAAILFASWIMKQGVKVHPTVLYRNVSSICLYLKIIVQAGAIPREGYSIQLRAHSCKLYIDELKWSKGQGWGGFLYCWP